MPLAAAKQAEARMTAFLTHIHQEFDPTVTVGEIRTSRCVVVRVSVSCGECDDPHAWPVALTHN